ncbi:MAG: sigma-70 family RNA polymerase sigma factor [Planctomycetota bacterium]|jgi:RNA polymerase sigma factor (TIGR02999 family)
MGEMADTTQILVDLGNGDRSAAKRLMPLVYDELRGLAQRCMQQERAAHTFQATALVHEAYIRLIDQSRVDWKGRAHFFSVAAEMIRRVLVDHARQHHAAKRGGGARKVSLTDSVGALEDPEIDLIALDEVLQELGRLNERHGKVVELRFFGGLSVEETAHVLEVSPQTVRSDWRMARAWLRQRLER